MTTNKGYKIYINIGVIIFIIAVMWTSISVYSYYTGPELQIDTYIKHFTQKEYDKLYEMIHKDNAKDQYTKEDLIACYKRLYEMDNTLIQLAKDGKLTYTVSQEDSSKKSAFYPLTYTYEDKQTTSKLYLTKTEEGWKIQFPFKRSDIKIYAPIGSKVFIGNELVPLYEEDYYSKKNMLPGKYSVSVEFPNAIYNDYKQTINIPYTTELFLPYTVLSVDIIAMKGTIVELAGVRKENTKGMVTFNNILEGNYEIKIYHPNDSIEPITKTIAVNKNERVFNIEEATLSAQGKSSLKQFITAFYEAYRDSIKAHTNENIQPYIGTKNKEKLIGDFNEWFIDNKKVLEAKIIAEPTQIKINNNGLLETYITETTELTNREFSPDENKVIDRTYKILIEWHTSIDISQNTWLISDRNVVQSIVAYKDYEGTWIEY